LEVLDNGVEEDCLVVKFGHGIQVDTSTNLYSTDADLSLIFVRKVNIFSDRAREIPFRWGVEGFGKHIASMNGILESATDLIVRRSWRKDP
jgi:hypothetical protein